MVATPMIPAPPICPRCGSKKFVEDAISLPAAPLVGVHAGVWRCDTCRLTFDGETWRDQTGAVWEMAESGT